MQYIHRDLEQKVLDLSRDYGAVLLTGPRQVGKTTMLRHIAADDREHVTLDDLDERRLAREDPAMFLQLHRRPLLIDEVQYAPQLFSYIKIEVDNGAPPGTFWLTGSQSFRMMDLAQESLAGRAALLHMSSLSQHELYGHDDEPPFRLNLDELQLRAQTRVPADLHGMYGRIWQGSMPGLISRDGRDSDVFYSSYMQTYLERDVGEAIHLDDKFAFQDFVRAAACRTGQMLNVHELARDAGVSDATAKRWLHVLEKSDVIVFLRPYSNNLLNRTVRKKPKLYFFDTGLVAYLARQATPEILANGLLSGAILENYVVCEILKSYSNQGRESLMWYYRDKDNNEIDLVLESDGKLQAMEVKRSVNPGSGLTRAFRILDRATLPRGKGAVICMRPTLSAIDRDNYIVPAWLV